MQQYLQHTYQSYSYDFDRITDQAYFIIENADLQF